MGARTAEEACTEVAAELRNIVATWFDANGDANRMILAMADELDPPAPVVEEPEFVEPPKKK